MRRRELIALLVGAAIAQAVTVQAQQSAKLPLTADKRLELLQEVVPNLRQLAFLGNAGNSVSMLEMREVQATARSLGLEVVALEIRRAADIPPAFDSIQGRANALFVVADPVLTANRVGINILAASAKLPTISNTREFVEAGGLMSYGPSFPSLFRRDADYVDKILRGAQPSDIPVEQPTKFDLIFNLTAAKALGLTVPQTLLATANEVIE
jgi:putative ABC transport system substrate-binding protein